MRPVQKQVSLGTTGGSTDWITIDYIQKAFAVGGRCTVGGATAPSGTYKVQHAFSSLLPDTEVKITRSTTTATVTFLSNVSGFNHGLTTNDAIRVAASGSTALDGDFNVASVTSATVITYACANAGAAAAQPGVTVERLFVGDNAFVTGATTSQDFSYAYPPNYIRATVTGSGSGVLTLSLNQGI